MPNARGIIETTTKSAQAVQVYGKALDEKAVGLLDKVFSKDAS
ncbi:MAG: hypothetical protein R3B51_05325 [Thermodesulfobacteriota bacterium]